MGESRGQSAVSIVLIFITVFSLVFEAGLFWYRKNSIHDFERDSFTVKPEKEINECTFSVG